MNSLYLRGGYFLELHPMKLHTEMPPAISWWSVKNKYAPVASPRTQNLKQNARAVPPCWSILKFIYADGRLLFMTKLNQGLTTNGLMCTSISVLWPISINFMEILLILKISIISTMIAVALVLLNSALVNNTPLWRLSFAYLTGAKSKP